MIPTTRDEFKEFCLRTLGKPVLQINVDDTQVEDRIDQAFYMYRQFHMDGTVKNFLKHEVSPSIMHFTGTPSVPFSNNEVIVGQTSNAHGQTVRPGALLLDANSIYMFGTNGPVAFIATGPSSSQAGDGKPFIDGEVIIGRQSGATATLGISGIVIGVTLATTTFLVGEDVIQTGNVAASGTINAINGANTDILYLKDGAGAFVVGATVIGSISGSIGTIYAASLYNPLELGDMDHKWIPIPDYIIAINKIFAPYDSRISADILFDPQSQFNMSLLSNFTSNSIIPYVIGRQYQQLLNDTFRGRPGIRFNRHQGKLYIDVNWYATFMPFSFIIVECYQGLDGDTAPGIWGDRWLQDYATALIQQQWGQNLSKFGQIALPGGVVLNGQQMKDEALNRLQLLEDRLRSEFQLPIDFIVG
jgi:hypothetical protein